MFSRPFLCSSSRYFHEKHKKIQGGVEDIRLRKRSVTERSAVDISEGKFLKQIWFIWFWLTFFFLFTPST